MSFYTYAHYRLDTNQIFYIGKGHGARYTQLKGRNKWWKKVVAARGFRAEIIAHWSAEADAFDHERFLIKCFRELGAPLVNICDGGQGASGLKYTDEQRAAQSARQMGRKNPPMDPIRRAEISARISAKLKGRSVNKGRKLSLETIAQRTASRYKTIPKHEEGGVVLTVREWAIRLGAHESTIRYRLATGKSPSGVLMKRNV